jgi:hypothetical protein
MIVTVHYHAGTEADLDAWTEALPGTDPERRVLVRMYLSFIRDRLIEFMGEPPEAVREPGIAPPQFWWEFYPNWWIVYTYKDRRRWFRPTVRRGLSSRSCLTCRGRAKAG